MRYCWTMQAGAGIKAFAIFILSLIIVPMTSPCREKRTPMTNKRPSRFYQPFPSCISHRTQNLLQDNYTPRKACRRACRLCVRGLENDDISIKVRVYKPSKPGNIGSTIGQWKVQDGLDSIQDFKKSLGGLANEIIDDQGRVIGIELGRPQITKSPNFSMGRDRGSQGSRDRAFGTDAIGSAISHLNLLITFSAVAQSLNHDRDQCCTTQEKFFMNTTLLDVTGNVRQLLQYSNGGSHQFIRHGVCGGQGGCRGRCVLQMINVLLAIHPPENNDKVTFKFFSIPGYCACKTFG